MLIFYNKLCEKLKKFFESDFYIYAIGFIVVLMWVLDWEKIGLVIFAILMIVILLTQDNIDGIVPIFIMICYMFGSKMGINSIPTYIYIFGGFVAVAFIYRLITLKKKFVFSKMNYAFLGFAICYLLSGLGTGYSIKGSLMVLAAIVLACLIYNLLFNQLKRNNVEYFLKSMVVSGLVLTFEVFLFYIFKHQPGYKDVVLGWGLSNNIAMMLLATIPCCFMMMTRNKNIVIYYVFACIESLALVLTISRGCIIILGIALIPMLILTYLKTDKKKLMLIATAILGVALLIFGIIFRKELWVLWQNYSHISSTGSGRTILFKEAWDAFMSNIVFGAGIMYRIEFNGRLYMFHSTILQVIGKAGLVGLVALLFHYYQKYMLCLKFKSIGGIFLALSMILPEIYGMFDVSYFVPYFIAVLIVTIAVMENCDSEHIENKKLIKE